MLHCCVSFKMLIVASMQVTCRSKHVEYAGGTSAGHFAFAGRAAVKIILVYLIQFETLRVMQVK